MSRLRILILISSVLIFIGISGWYVYTGIRLGRTTFPAGAPPEDVKKAILPKQVSLTQLRPPALRPTDPIRYGSATSVVSVIEFGDFECAACRQMKQTIASILPKYQGRVRFVWRDLPVEDVNPHALAAAIFARCAQAQGKFWAAYDALFASDTLNEAIFRSLATQLALDPVALDQCRRNSALKAALQADVDVARGDGINTAPLIFIGTKALTGVIAPDILERELKLFLSS